MEGLPSKEEWFNAMAEYHGAAVQRRLLMSSVAVCGLGGLGSNIALSLARAGVGGLILIDFDEVNITNLNRQQYKAAQLGMKKAKALAENLYEIAPYTRLKALVCKVTEENLCELLQAADIVCEAFDEPEEKAMLVNGVLERLPDKYLVAGSGMAGFASANLIRTRKITERFILCGDGISDVSEGKGLVSSRTAVCAAHQAHAVIRIISGEREI